METLISPATKRNWEKLHTDAEDRLTKRANKRQSKRKILPQEYLSNPDNAGFVRELVTYAEENGWELEDVLYTLGVMLLQRKGIFDRAHVQAVLREYQCTLIPQLLEMELPEDEWDLPGLVYQSSLSEGTKNVNGSYYTPKRVTEAMTRDFDFSRGQTFFDPCCGSGAFLLSLEQASPQQLFGADRDPAAVMLAKFNLLLAYGERPFIPQIVCCDYLREGVPFRQADGQEMKFDYIAANPPWGAASLAEQPAPGPAFKESFSCFFVKACGQLKEQGTIRFLFPEAVLNVKAHKALRVYMLEHCRITGITIYDDYFTGVATKYIDIECKKAPPVLTVRVKQGAGERTAAVSGFYETNNRVFCLLDQRDAEIIRYIKEAGRYTLSDSIWAMGIVTGDNRGRLKRRWEEGCEPIYTGKEVTPYVLKPAEHYLFYDKTQLQQTAKEEYYRSPEKLVYKFISSRLVFAYDNTGGLLLNSANTLIPRIPHMSIKTVLAFLNSEVFQFLYYKLFGEIKILRGNLEELPFPEISREQNRQIEALVDEILEGDSSRTDCLQTEIYRCFRLTQEQIAHIKEGQPGKTKAAARQD